MSRFHRASGQRSARDGCEAGIDPVCHTLFGAALSRSGLGKRSALGTTALVLGANMPDVDVLAYFAGPAADLEWRRGWTHGVLALVVFPFLLTGFLLLLNRLVRPRASAVVPIQLLLLSAIAILSHPLLDSLNTYGVRWLMPFSSRWYYGDALFIVDPWVWLVLATGLIWSWARRNESGPSRSRPVRLALITIVLYMVAMLASGVAARQIIRGEVQNIFGGPVNRAMPGPVPLDVLERSFVVEQDSVYRVGTFRWLRRPQIAPSEIASFPRGRPSHAAFAQAESNPAFQRFLSWARFPTFTIDSLGHESFVVHVVDLRYARRPDSGFGTLSVPIRLR